MKERDEVGMEPTPSDILVYSFMFLAEQEQQTCALLLYDVRPTKNFTYYFYDSKVGYDYVYYMNVFL